MLDFTINQGRFRTPTRSFLNLSTLQSAVLLVISTFFFTASCASRAGGSGRGDVVVTAADEGQTVRIAPGERLLVELIGNPSNGRSWELRSLPDAAVLVPDGTRWVAMPDGGDSDLTRMQQLRFVAQGPGRALLLFEYVRPRASDAGASSFGITVEVATR